eukprot:11197978-Lingulodinium_polyedra.AAC.1
MDPVRDAAINATSPGDIFCQLIPHNRSGPSHAASPPCRRAHSTSRRNSMRLKPRLIKRPELSRKPRPLASPSEGHSAV